MPSTPDLPQAQAASRTARSSRLRASGRLLREVVLIGVPALLALPSAGDVDPAGGLVGGLTTQGWVRLVAAVAVAVLLLVRRRRPLVAVAGIAVLVAVAGGAVWLASLVVLLSVVTRAHGAGHARRALLAAGLLWLGYAVRVFFTAPVPQPPWSSLNGLITVVFAGVMLALVACAGLYRGARRQLLISAQERAARAETDQQRSADLARQRERALIAREMHDVLAHRLSVLALHAGALEYRADVAGGEVAQAAGVVRRSAHEALQDLRQVLGVLREDNGSPLEPAPVPAPAAGPRTAHDRMAEDRVVGGGQEGLRPLPEVSQVDDLVQEARTTGAQVGLQVDGDLRAVPTAVSRAGYRVVQEGLTNARKHAAGAPVWVDLAVTEHELIIQVRNAARPAVPVRAQAAPGRADNIISRRLLAPAAEAELDLPGSGTGLLGVDERAVLLGGRAEHGATPDGGYRLQVDLPLTQLAPDLGHRPEPGAGAGTGQGLGMDGAVASSAVDTRGRGGHLVGGNGGVDPRRQPGVQPSDQSGEQRGNLRGGVRR
ncbi:sensor histidine kinase [Quadrisphaera sp. INWT6]|uniref:sensor histidine kinase n=1 Tax=Quadrisphaera sp. INWT6 TaxID=2596917 RepID=UPI0018926F37|nr:histidine kinase [Quadrisphaera sp. INWT6]MBF5082159.1 hypothetical protein [Quadrisphaera sp. INWT6]